MKRIAFFLAMTFLGYVSVQAQTRFITRTGNAKIFSHTAAEDITATNTTVTGLIDATSGDVAVSVPVQGFRFEKSLMQEHFNNEQFMDSKKFPKISLKGKITNLSTIDFTKDGAYDAQITGDLTIKGTTKSVIEKAHVTISNGKITVRSKFMVKDIGSYNVGKPKGSKKNNVADDIEITYTATYEKENS